MTQFVQVALTDELARLLAEACQVALQNLTDEDISEAEKTDLQRMVVFFSEVNRRPTEFAPTGDMARSVKGILRRAKGPAQPQSRKNKRKARQERRQGGHKRRRQERREMAEAYNEARARIEAEMKEGEAYEQELKDKVASEPKFDVLADDGRVLLAGVPKSYIRPIEGADPPKSEIILPPDVQAGLDEMVAS